MLEIARLSLTVADVPHPNGWEELKRGDMFAGKKLQEESERSRVLLVNPPFEGTKPLRVLQQTIPHLPPGAVFGVIVPAGLLSSPRTNARPAEMAYPELPALRSLAISGRRVSVRRSGNCDHSGPSSFRESLRFGHHSVAAGPRGGC